MTLTHFKESSRHGITLMEVLIAIGILSIGLTSVAALLPAGGSQARKAIISDRAANLAENALADAVTIGLVRPASLTVAGTSRVLIDAVGSLGLTGIQDTALKTTGVRSTATEGSAVSTGVGMLFGQGRDDIVFTPSAGQDSLPTNAFVDGARAFDGKTSCLWAIETLSGDPIAAGGVARLSAVIFHERDSASRIVAANISPTGEITITGALPFGRTTRDVLKTGTVLVVAPSTVAADRSAFFGVRSASLNAAGSGAFCVFDQQPPAVACNVLLDSVGIAQAIVTLEGSGPFASTTPREVVP